MKCINIQDALRKNYTLIDVRAPYEYQADTIPGAVNVPLLDNTEREKVGTIYKEKGSKEARNLGLELIADKLPDKVKTISQLENENKLVVFCWRGGLRSKSVVCLLDLMGIEAFQLKGGYKAFRRLVNSFFETEDPLPIDFFVLCGLTGVGKTEVLKHLDYIGENVIDLEGLANNRGSVFGDIGLGMQPSQKAFETALFNKISRGNRKPFYVECESKRIGKLQIPSSMFNAMKKGKRILLFDSLENRTKRIVAEYVSEDNNRKDDLSEAVFQLKKRLGKKRVVELTELINKGKFEEVVRFLLVNYYDPEYAYPDKEDDRFLLSLKNTNSEETAYRLKDSTL